MNKRGVTILELLISISIVAVILLLLMKVFTSMSQINQDDTYASSDEISRTEIIKNIEHDFLELGLNGITVRKGTGETMIEFQFKEERKTLIVKEKELTYQNVTYSLESKNATYSLDSELTFLELENDYYYTRLVIPVLIHGENKTECDDIILPYLGLKNEFTNYDGIANSKE